MSSSTMKSLSYVSKKNSFYDRMDVREQFSKTIPQIAKDHFCLGLNPAKSCLAVGPGDGLFEIEFFKHIMPDLKSLTAVEPCPQSAAELRHNLQRHMSNVDSVVHEKTIQEFMRESRHGGQSYDAILIFHVFYYINGEDRAIMCRSLFGDLLRPGGTLVVQHACKRSSDNLTLCDLLNPSHGIPSYEDMKAEALKVGFEFDVEFEFPVALDCRDPDDLLLAFFSYLVRKEITMDKFKTAVSSLSPDWQLRNSYMIGMFRTSGVEHACK